MTHLHFPFDPLDFERYTVTASAGMEARRSFKKRRRKNYYKLKLSLLQPRESSAFLGERQKAAI
jgi:hypothetical protein